MLRAFVRSLVCLLAAALGLQPAAGAATAERITYLSQRGDAVPYDLAVAAGRLYVPVIYWSRPEHTELWVVDETGPHQLAPDPADDTCLSTYFELAVFGDRAYVGVVAAYFVGQSAGCRFGPEGLWRTDGTIAGTRSATGRRVPVSNLTPAGGRLFYVESLSQAGDLCSIDRDDTETCVGASLWIKPEFGEIQHPVEPVAVAARVFFAAANGIESNDFELWSSDGTASGTRVVVDLQPGEQGSRPRYLTALGSAVYFVADGPGVGAQIWRSDGTAAGTVQVAKEFTEAHSLVAVGERLFFVGKRTGTGRGLGVYDPASGEARFLRKGSSLQLRVPINGALLFGDEGALWTTDGTVEGTIILRRFNFATGFYPLADGRVAFQGEGGFGSEPWVTDGTPDGTAQLADINPGLGSSSPLWFKQIDGRLYFIADDGTGSDVWSLPLATKPLCAGDCNADGRTAIDELITGVSLVLSGGVAGSCPDLDADRSGALEISDLIAAVGVALNGCPS